MLMYLLGFICVYRNHTLAAPNGRKKPFGSRKDQPVMSVPTDKVPASPFQREELDAIRTFVLLIADTDFRLITALSLLEGARDDAAVKLHDRMVGNISSATGYLNNQGRPIVSRPEGIVKAAPSFRTFVNLLPHMDLDVPEGLMEELKAHSLTALRWFYEDKTRAGRLHDTV